MLNFNDPVSMEDGTIKNLSAMSGGGGGGGGVNYPAEETAIGKWIDGRTVYRKCWTIKENGVANPDYSYGADVLTGLTELENAVLMIDTKVICKFNANPYDFYSATSGSMISGKVTGVAYPATSRFYIGNAYINSSDLYIVCDYIKGE